MPGRHASSSGSGSRALPAFLVVLAAGLIAVGGFVLVSPAVQDDTGAADCSGSVAVRLAAAPEIAPVLEEATKQLEADGATVEDACVDYQITAAPAPKVTSALGQNPQEAPQLWVPASSLSVERASQAGATPTVVTKSLALSPVVVVGSGISRPASWLEVLGSGDVSFVDPLENSAAAAALLAVQSETKVTKATEAEVGGVLVPLAQEYGATEKTPNNLEDVAAQASNGKLGVMSEQQLVNLQRRGAQQLEAKVPESGTLALDYPLAALGSDPVASQAASKLTVFMAGDRGAQLLQQEGFRTTRNDPLPNGEGLGKQQIRILQPPDAETAGSSLRQWAVLTVPSRALAVFDVSGSMDFVERGRSRISLAVEAANAGLQRFPDNAQLGLWAFSVGLGGGNQDYRELVKIRALGADARGSGGTHRDAMASEMKRLPNLTDGGTGLYDTTLAAIRTVQNGYDPRAINSVILLTDGENDDPGSLRLKELLRTIERERDPARPVVVIAIGMGPEADEAALRRIANATGGRSYIARDPNDINEVFTNALLSR